MKPTDSHVEFVKKEKAYALLAQKSVPFCYATVGVTYPDPAYRIDRTAATRLYVFEYVEEGEGEILLNEQWQRVCAGDVYILCAGEEHHYRANPQDPWKKRWINYNADYISDFLKAYGVSSGVYHGTGARKYFDLAFETAKFGGAYAQSGRTVADCVHKIIARCAASACGRAPFARQNPERAQYFLPRCV